MNEVRRATTWRAAVVAALLAFAAAAGAQDAFLQELKAEGAPPPGYGAVFGRIVLVEDGEEKEFNLFREMSIFVTSLADGRTERIRLLGDSRFLWALKPGEYAISAYLYRTATGRLWTVFAVPEPGRAAYVGDLHLQIDEKSRGYRYAVRDAYEARLAKDGARLAAAKLEPAKALMQVEGPLGNFKRIGDICQKMWDLECTRTFRGVEAVSPPGTQENFPATTSLTPLLEWKPSAAPGVSYDVAVYEAVMLLGSWNLPGRRVQSGALVAYIEDLAEPRYQFSAPLKPGQRYFWSVRLRLGDTVSSWSTTGYFVFLLVAAASGSGGWFGFATPGP